MLPNTSTDIVRLAKMEIDQKVELLARRYPHGTPPSEPRRFSLVRIGRKLRRG